MRGRLLQSGWIGAVGIACLLGGFVGVARADVALIDASQLRYHIDTGETAAGGDSASGAVTDADYTAPVHLTTQAGGTSSAMPTDTFDGYSLLALAFAAAVPTEIASKKDSAFFFYNMVGADSTLDSACDNRQVIVPKQTLTSGSKSIEVQRLVFVPADDEFIRWINILHNPGSSAVAFHAGIANNVGSDDKTIIVTSSDGDATAALDDTWVTTMQDYSSAISSDPRIGHVMQGQGSLRAPVSVVGFDADASFWWYDVNLKAGETVALMTFATAQPNKADAAAKAAEIASLENAHMLDCMDETLRSQLANFHVQCALAGDEGESCDDANPCTLDDTCADGACAGTPKDCRSKPSDCTGVCDPSSGACDNSVNLDDGTSCSNGDVCDGKDTCQDGTCKNTGKALKCDDGEVCTADACDAKDGCSNTLIDGCKACSKAADCDDGNACDGIEACSGDKTCRAGTALDCNDGDDCTSDVCLPSRGCRHTEITTGMCGPNAGSGGTSGSSGNGGNGSSGRGGSSGGGDRDGGDRVGDAGDAGDDVGSAARGSHGGLARGKDVEHSTGSGCSSAAVGSTRGGLAAAWLLALVCLVRRGRLV
jgi:uncharacterized membrane protein YgcG